jgi:hypothetical protein
VEGSWGGGILRWRGIKVEVVRVERRWLRWRCVAQEGRLLGRRVECTVTP